MAIEDPTRPVEGALRVWFKVFKDSDLSRGNGDIPVRATPSMREH